MRGLYFGILSEANIKQVLTLILLEKSIEMFLIWKEHHHSDSDFEKIARNWNGGPSGFKKSRTEKYWEKVEAELEI